jgi:thiamine biosynthesis lipoprotein
MKITQTTYYLLGLIFGFLATLGLSKVYGADAPPTGSELKCDIHVSMNVQFRICVFAGSSEAINLGYDLRRAWDKMDEIATWLDARNPQSALTQVNQKAANLPQVVRTEIWDMLKLARHLFDLSAGHFDITVAPVTALYEFSTSHPREPTSAEIKERLPWVGMDKLTTDEGAHSFKFKTQGMRFTFEDMAVGFAIDRTVELMKKYYPAGSLEGGSTVRFWGQRPDHEPWEIRLHDPEDKGKLIATVTGNEFAVSTAGITIRSFEIGSHRVHPFIDAKSGLPSDAAKQCSVVSEQALLADAYDSACLIMGSAAVKPMTDEHLGIILVDKQNKVMVSGMQKSATPADTYSFKSSH